MAKLVKYIFIPFFFIFLMSHNASAVSTVLDMHEYDVINQEGSLSVNCEFYRTSQNVSNVKECTGWPTETSGFGLSFLRKMESVDLWAVNEGDIVEFDVNLFSPFDNGFPTVATHLYFLGGSADFTAVEYKQTVNNSLQAGILFNGQQNNYGATQYYQSVYHVTYRARRDATVRIGLTSSQHWFEWYGFDTAKMTFAIYNVMHYRYVGSQENKEQKEAAEDAAADSQTSGSSSQNDATSATSSLISVITSGIGAITSASASNCVINADMGNFDMGSIDLCANPVPTFMQVIGSIIAALVVLPLVIVLFNRFIAIIGSFQR